MAFAWLILHFVQQTRAPGHAAQDGYAARRARGALAAMVAALVHGLVDNFYFVPDLAFSFWLLLALVEAPRTEQESSSPTKLCYGINDTYSDIVYHRRRKGGQAQIRSSQVLVCYTK